MRKNNYIFLLRSFLLAGYMAAAAVLYCAYPASALATQGGFRVVRNQVFTNNGQLYIPEGISVYGGLEAWDYNVNTANIQAQIKAAAQYWHANTIRLQVSEDNLFSHLKKGQTYNPNFLSSLDAQVSYAQNLGLAVVINDQTEFTDSTPSPTDKTLHFWKVVATHFKSQPYVIFDLFNEPRLTSRLGTNQLATRTPYKPQVGARLLAYREPTTPMTPQQAWSLWRNGGTVNGTRYRGMQDIVNQVRATGATNLLWIEGTYDARRLPPEKYLLQDQNLAYAIHHPNLNNPKSWSQIGNLAAIQPVVEGEWAQYQSSWAECYSKAYTNAPEYLHYLHEHNIGIIAWSLQANSLVERGTVARQPNNLNTPSDPKSADELSRPTQLTAKYVCGHVYGQGVGSLLQDYFANNSAQYDFQSS